MNLSNHIYQIYEHTKNYKPYIVHNNYNNYNNYNDPMDLDLVFKRNYRIKSHKQNIFQRKRNSNKYCNICRQGHSTNESLQRKNEWNHESI